MWSEVYEDIFVPKSINFLGTCYAKIKSREIQSYYVEILIHSLIT